MKTKFGVFVRRVNIFLLTGVFVFPAIFAQAAPMKTFHGHMPAAVGRLHLQPLRNLAGTNRLHLAIGLPLRNQEALTNLLQQLYDSASTNYHHWLTPEQFTERFGPSAQDYQAVISFAKANGLTVAATYPNRLLVDVKGTVTKVQKAFHVTMKVYQHPSEKRTFYAPNVEPSVAATLPILSINGLNNYSLPHPCFVARPLVAGQAAVPNAGSGPGGTYMGYDFRKAYAPDTTLTGTGQAVGLLQFDGYTASDITYYENKAGLPNVTLTNVLIDGATGQPSGNGGEIEVSLDIEMAISMAPGLSRVIVYEAPNPSPFIDILNRMASDDLAKQLSCSWYLPGGEAEPAADLIFKEMAAQGQSFFNASGDSGAYTGLIPFPGDNPYITQVGGTSLTTDSNGTWSSETTWNQPALPGSSGGGISTQYPIPDWQTGIDMGANGGSTTMRNTPDVALTAENVYVRADGSDQNLSGTSCAAPLWAGFMALVNQQAVAEGEPAVGFINPIVYAIGKSNIYNNCFHDITNGNNYGFNAVTGYDLCTGWGTPAGQTLINAIAPPEAMPVSPVGGFIGFGFVGGPFTVTSETFVLTNTGTASLNWSLANNSTWLDASSGSGTLAPGATADVTVSLNANADSLTPGNYTANVQFVNQTDNVIANRQFSLTMIGQPEPASQTVELGGTATFSATPPPGPVPFTYQWQLNGKNLSDGGIITTVVGNGNSGYSGDNVYATNTSLNFPQGVAMDASGNLFIADYYNNRVRKVNANDIITTVAGGGAGGGNDGLGDGGQATNATLSFPAGVAVDAAGDLFIADLGNGRIRKVDPSGVITTVAGGGAGGGNDGLGDGGQATNATLSYPGGVAVDAAGDLFIADEGNNRIREVNPNGIITTVAGGGPGGGNDGLGDNGWATNAILANPSGVTVDASGNLFIADTYDLRVRKVDTNGVITTVAGSGAGPIIFTGNGGVFLGDGGQATNANLSTPEGVAVDTYGNLFIADGGENMIRKVDTNGIITAVAGIYYYYSFGSYNYSGDGGPAIYAYLGDPTGIALDNAGNLFIADRGNNRIRKVDLLGTYPALTLNNVTYADAGNYTLVVSTPDGSITSSVATLNVSSPPTPPVITTLPTNQVATVGQDVTFSVTAQGTSPLSYQWEFNGSPISGATGPTYAVDSVTTGNAGSYTVVVNNSAGSASASARLYVVPAGSGSGNGSGGGITFLNGSFLVNYTFRGDMTYLINGDVTVYNGATFEGGAVIKYMPNASLTLGEAAVSDLATPYRPVIFTAVDDNSAGATIPGSTGHPTNYYANPAIYFITPGGTWNFSNFKVAHASQGISLDCLYNGLNVTLRDGQIVNCGTAIETAGPTSLALYNMLVANVQYAVDQGSPSVQAQNSTFVGMPSSMYIAPSLVTPTVSTPITFNLTNCIIADFVFINAGHLNLTVGGNYCGFYRNSGAPFGSSYFTTATNPFETVGGGNYYLTNGCAFTNVGTINIDPTLLADLRTRTTHAPVAYTNTTVGGTWVPTAQRDTNAAPDLGYHYAPIDYELFNEVTVSSQLTLSNGVVVAIYWGGELNLNVGSSLQMTSIGTVRNHNEICYSGTVQEEAAGNGNGILISLNGYNPSYINYPPLLKARFTDFDGVGGVGTLVGGYLMRLDMRDCQVGPNPFACDILSLSSSDTNQCINNLFERTRISLTDVGGGNGPLVFYNNLVRYGSLEFDKYNGTYSWLVRNNLFDNTTITNKLFNGPFLQDHNGYLNTTEMVSGTPGDVLLTGLAYERGPLGNYYQPTNSPLIHKGSTTADQLGLYYYTVTTDQAIEGTNVVSIGYHYVALDTNGNPLDSANGILDYLAIPDGPAAPVNSAQSLNGNTSYSFNITGPAGSSWNVYASSDLTNWTQVGGVTLDAAGTATFTDSAINGVPYRFYYVGNGQYCSQAIGFERMMVPAGGYQMIADPLITPTNTLDGLFNPMADGTHLPDGSQVFPWSGTNFDYYTWNSNGWSPNGSAALSPGSGAFVYNASSNQITVSFSGLVPQGNLTNQIVSGEYIYSPMLPEGGGLSSVLNFPPTGADQLDLWNVTNQMYDLYMYSRRPPGRWIPSEPVINVGQAFFLNTSTNKLWEMNYSPSSGQ